MSIHSQSLDHVDATDPGPATFRVLLTVQIHPTLTGRFEEQWKDGNTEVIRQPGNRGHWLGCSDADPATYFVVSDWRDETSFRTFEASDQHITHRQKMHPFRVSGSMATMTLTDGRALSYGTIVAPA